MFNLKKTWKDRYLKYYKKSRWPIVVDVASVFSVFALLILFISLYLYNPQILIGPDFNNKKAEELISKYTLDVDNPPIALNFSFVDNYISQVEPNSVLKISLKNSSPLEIKNIIIKLSSPGFLQLEKVELINPRSEVVLINDNELRVSKIKPESEELINLKINWSRPNIGAQASDLNVSLNYSIGNHNLKKNFSLKTPKTESILKSQAVILYTAPSGDKLGLGPLPPITGLPTNYWLFFDLESFGEVNDFIMTAKLANNVNLTGNSSVLAGDFSYDEETKVIFWKIKDSEALKDNVSPRLGLEIQFIPQANQVGALASLVEKINYFAKDSISGKDLRGSLVDIKTDIPDDLFYNGQGVIRSGD